MTDAARTGAPESTSGREHWSSRLGFLFATLGAAIGLGNLWRFPYVAGKYGGGAFVLVYLVFVFVVSIPLVMAELSLGRRGQSSPVGTMRRLCAEAGSHPVWQGIGWLSILAPIAGLCFYSVVGGWSLAYAWQAVAGHFSGISPAAADALFNRLLASPWRLLFWYTLYIGFNVYVVSRGIRGGIERVTTIMMPALLVMLVVLVVYSHAAGAPARAWKFLFDPDFSKLTMYGVLTALGQCLFSVSVGTGALITYGAYLSSDVNLPGVSWIIALADTAAALLAGLAIFPIVFASGMNPAEGPGLMFVTLPVALGHMPFSYFFSIVFFVLVFFAAYTSSLAMFEPFVSWLVDTKGMARKKVTFWTGAGVWAAGILAILSFNVLKDFTPLSFIPLYKGKNIFGILEFTVSNVILPANALMIALFAGWVFRKTLREEIGFKHRASYFLWSLLTRYVAPIAVGAVMIYGFFS